jgi:hypothetical protein
MRVLPYHNGTHFAHHNGTHFAHHNGTHFAHHMVVGLSRQMVRVLPHASLLHYIPQSDNNVTSLFVPYEPGSYSNTTQPKC